MLLILLLLVAISSVAAAAAPVTCSKTDKRATFTPCSDESNTKLAVEFYAPGCTTNGSAALRSPVAVPCVKSCGSGEWYSPATLGCSRCNPGSFSNSGGRIINEFPAIPEGFTTYCHPEPCDAWHPSGDGGYLHSGNQSGLRATTTTGWVDERVRSALITIVPVINPNGGKVMASYRVESERYYDGLNVYVNGSKWGSASAFLLSGVQQTWRRLVVDLPLGTSEVEFTFDKDRDQSSLPPNGTVGDDRAFLRDIVIEGVQMYASECTPCPSGQFSAGFGAQRCTTCPKDHHSTRGSKACQPCPHVSWAPPGSAKCIRRLPCVADDYVATYTKCDSTTGKRMQTWILASKICTPAEEGAGPPPHPQDHQVPCDQCMRGYHWDNDVRKCIACITPGERLNPKNNVCEFCAEGTAAVPVIDFSGGFERFGGEIDPGYFDSKCDGECDCPDGLTTCLVQGFELASVHDESDIKDMTRVVLRSSYDVGAKYQASLTYEFSASSAGSVFFTYGFIHTGRGRERFNEIAQGWVTIDGLLHPLHSRVAAPLKDSMSLPFEARGDHKVVFVIDQDAGNTAPTDRVALAIYGMRVTGDSRGATDTCAPCPRGHYCPPSSDTFTPCTAGTYAPGFGNAECSTCPKGTVAAASGMTTCRSCSRGTAAGAGNIHCVNKCKIDFPGAQFDLSSLRGQTFGPVWVNQANSALNPAEADTAGVGRFYFSMCDHVNTINNELCSRRFGADVEPSYMCERISGNRSYSLGVEPDYRRNAAGDLTVKFNGGDHCTHGGMTRSSNVTLKCNPELAGSGNLEFTEEKPHCAYHFTLTTAAACPKCTVKSFDRLIGPCKVNQKQSIRWVKRDSDRFCAGGFTPPGPVEADCNRCLPSYYTRSWSDCVFAKQERVYILKDDHATCIDDGTSLAVLRATDKFHNTLSQTCNKIEVKFGANPLTVTAIVLLFVFISLLCVVLLVFIRFRSLKQQYERLATTADGNNNEMYDVNDHNDAISFPAESGTNDRAVVYDDPSPVADISTNGNGHNTAATKSAEDSGHEY